MLAVVVLVEVLTEDRDLVPLALLVQALGPVARALDGGEVVLMPMFGRLLLLVVGLPVRGVSKHDAILPTQRRVVKALCT